MPDADRPFPGPPLPPGDLVDLPGRGTTFSRYSPAPTGAPTLLLLHGWMATADLNWFRTYAALSRRYGILTIDHRGHGKGIRTRRPFRLEECADDAAALARAKGLTSIIPVGYSMGGPIAQLVWRRHRQLVDGLVLCATSRNFGKSPRERAMFGSLFGLGFLAGVAPQRVRAEVMQRVTSRLPEGRINEWAMAQLQQNDLPSLLFAGAAIGGFNSRDWIGEVDVPAAVVVTMQDQVVPTRRQLRLSESIPGATVHQVAADHGACAFAPDRFIPALVDAVESVRSRAGVRSAG